MVRYRIKSCIKRNKIRAFKICNAGKDQVRAAEHRETLPRYELSASDDQIAVNRVNNGMVIHNVKIPQNLLLFAVLSRNGRIHFKRGECRKNVLVGAGN